MKKTMLQFFLSPHGLGLRLAQAFLLVSGAWLAYDLAWLNGQWIWLLFYGSFVVLKGFSWIRWYGSNLPRRGIEDHFDKVNVLMAWMCLGAGVVAYGFSVQWPLYLMLLPMGFFIFFNGVLVFFHWRDSDSMAPNALSGDTRVF